MCNGSGTKRPLRKLTAMRGIYRILITFAVLLVLLTVFACINPNFCSLTNIVNLLRQIAPILIISIAQSLVMITGKIDLSIGSVVGLSTMISATLMSRGILSPLPAALVTMACCMLMGAVNGLLVAQFQLPSFIVTLGTMTIGRGIAQLANGSYNTDAITKFYPQQAHLFKQALYYGKTLGLYNGIWIAVMLWVMFDFLLRRTRTGRCIYAVGSNPNGARLSGVNVSGTILLVYIISAFCSFVVGVINCASVGQGTMDSGASYEMSAVASAVIGGVSILGGRGSLLGVAAGAAIWGTLQNGLQFASAPVAIRNIIIGVIMVLLVLMDVVMRTRRRDRDEGERHAERI